MDGERPGEKNQGTKKGRSPPSGGKDQLHHPERGQK